MWNTLSMNNTIQMSFLSDKKKDSKVFNIIQFVCETLSLWLQKQGNILLWSSAYVWTGMVSNLLSQAR